MSTLGSLSEVSARVSRGRHTYRYVHVFLGGDLRTDVYRLLSCVFLHMYVYIYTCIYTCKSTVAPPHNSSFGDSI